MVQAINTLRKDRETRDWQQVMDIMGRVKEEHGARGLGLSHVYQIGIGACVDFARPAEALQLFDEVGCGCGCLRGMMGCLGGNRGEGLVCFVGYSKVSSKQDVLIG